MDYGSNQLGRWITVVRFWDSLPYGWELYAKFFSWHFCCDNNEGLPRKQGGCNRPELQGGQEQGSGIVASQACFRHAQICMNFSLPTRLRLWHTCVDRPFKSARPHTYTVGQIISTKRSYKITRDLAGRLRRSLMIWETPKIILFDIESVVRSANYYVLSQGFDADHHFWRHQIFITY